MWDKVTIRVKLVNDPVSILLHTRREYNNFIVLGHLTQELIAEGPDQEVWLALVTIFNIMN